MTEVPTEEGKLFDTTHPGHAEVVAACGLVHHRKQLHVETKALVEEAHDRLLDLMDKHGLTEFRHEGIEADGCH